MKKIFVIIGVILLVVSASYFFISSAENKWIDKAEFGEWGQEILLEYEDGSTSNILGIYHDDKKVSAFRYVLSAKATGDYDFVEIDLNDYQIEIFIQNDNDMHAITRSEFTSRDINCDNQWTNLCNMRITDEELNPPSNQLPFGNYVISIQPGGSIRYRGFMVGRTDWGNYESVNLPSAISFFVTINDDRTLTVELDNEVGEEYDDWSWSLQTGYTNEIIIDQFMVNCIGSYKPEDVFASIANKIDVVFQTQGGSIKSWVPGRPHNTLENIIPNTNSPLTVVVFEDCIFTIQKC